MKRLIIIAIAVALTLTMSGNVYAWTISGTLRQPFDSTGYTNISPNGQTFMEWYSSVNKYHMAEDWNRLGGNDCGDPLYAIGDGFVRDVRNNPDENNTIGKSLIVRYTLPDASQVDSVYWHVQDIYVSVGMNVQRGDKIATIGNATSSKYPSGLYACHLHWETRRVTGFVFNWNTDSYLNSATYPGSIDIHPLPTSPPTPGALDYTSPSLFVDDRKTSNVYGLSPGSWTYFSVGFNAPSSTSYVEYNNGRYSLKRAVDNGLIWQSVWVQISGTWYYYPDITKVLFESGKTYAMYGFLPNTNLFILTPGHNYKTDRAKIDMIRAVSGNGNFKSVKPDEFKVYTSDSSFDYWKMPFIYNNGSGNQPIDVYQATLKSNPIVRYTIYYDPATGWTPWTAVDPNTLY